MRISAFGFAGAASALGYAVLLRDETAYGFTIYVATLATLAFVLGFLLKPKLSGIDAAFKWSGGMATAMGAAQVATLFLTYDGPLDAVGVGLPAILTLLLIALLTLTILAGAAIRPR